VIPGGVSGGGVRTGAGGRMSRWCGRFGGWCGRFGGWSFSGWRGRFTFLAPSKAGEGEQNQTDKQFSRKYPTGLVQFHLAFSL
jgi:hypothetical protein